MTLSVNSRDEEVQVKDPSYIHVAIHGGEQTSTGELSSN
jgi:hypothetical protein